MFQISPGDIYVFIGLLFGIAGSRSNTLKDSDISTIKSSFINSTLIVFGSLISIPGIIFSSMLILYPWYKIIIILPIVFGIYWIANKNNLLKFPRIIDTLCFLVSSFVFVLICYLIAYLCIILLRIIFCVVWNFYRLILCFKIKMILMLIFKILI